MSDGTDFYSVGFDSVDCIERVDTGECYFVVGVTFGDGSQGELLYPYRVNSAFSEGVVIDSGPQGAFVRVPAGDDSEADEDGYRRESIGLSSDVPSWVREEVSSLVLSDSEASEVVKEAHNLRELEFKF